MQEHLARFPATIDLRPKLPYSSGSGHPLPGSRTQPIIMHQVSLSGVLFICGPSPPQGLFLGERVKEAIRRGEINRASPDYLLGAVEATKHECGGGRSRKRGNLPAVVLSMTRSVRKGTRDRIYGACNIKSDYMRLGAYARV